MASTDDETSSIRYETLIIKSASDTSKRQVLYLLHRAGDPDSDHLDYQEPDLNLNLLLEVNPVRVFLVYLLIYIPHRYS